MWLWCAYNASVAAETAVPRVPLRALILGSEPSVLRVQAAQVGGEQRLPRQLDNEARHPAGPQRRRPGRAYYIEELIPLGLTGSNGWAEEAMMLRVGTGLDQ